MEAAQEDAAMTDSEFLISLGLSPAGARPKTEEQGEVELYLKEGDGSQLIAAELAQIRLEEAMGLTVLEAQAGEVTVGCEDLERRLKNDAKLRAEAESQLKEENEARIRAKEAELQLKAEQEAPSIGSPRASGGEDLRTEEQARLKAEEEARFKAEEEKEKARKLKTGEESRYREEEPHAKAEQEARMKEEGLSKHCFEVEPARLKAEEEAIFTAEEEKTKETQVSTEEKTLRREREKEEELQVEMDKESKLMEKAYLQWTDELHEKEDLLASENSRFEAGKEGQISDLVNASSRAKEEEEAKPPGEAPKEEAKPAQEAPEEEAKPAEEAPKEEAKPAKEAPEEEAKPAEEAPKEEAKPAKEAGARPKTEEEEVEVQFKEGDGSRLTAAELAQIRLEETMGLTILEAQAEEVTVGCEDLERRVEKTAKLRAEEELKLKEENDARIRANEAKLQLKSEQEARRGRRPRASGGEALRTGEKAPSKAEEAARLKAEEEKEKAEDTAFQRMEEQWKRNEEKMRSREEELMALVEQEARMRDEGLNKCWWKDAEDSFKAANEAQKKIVVNASSRAKEEDGKRAEQERRSRVEEKRRRSRVEEERLKAEKQSKTPAQMEGARVKKNTSLESALTAHFEQHTPSAYPSTDKEARSSTKKAPVQSIAAEVPIGDTPEQAKTKADEEAVKEDRERRWCPDTWWWYNFQELQKQFSSRFSEREVLEHWNYKMQRDRYTEGKDPDAKVSSWQLPSLNKFPHGVVHLSRSRMSEELWPCRYMLLKPPGFEETTFAWPCLLFLHGHHEISKPEVVAGLFSGNSCLFDKFALHNFIIIIPLAERGSGLLHNNNHEFDTDMVAKVFREAVVRLENRVDPRRVSVTGYSMGADAAVQLAATHGEHFAAIAPFCGAYEWFKSAKLADLAAIRGVEVRCFHNDLDNYVKVAATNDLLSHLGRVCACSRPTVRSIVIPYPSNILSFAQQMAALSDATAHVQIRITEHDGGSKASWVLRDAKHLSDAHVCWPIVYANESTFGLFHWMLRCGALDKRRSWPKAQRRKLTMQEAEQFLMQYNQLLSGSPQLKQMSAKLAAQVERDKFLHLAHFQRLIEVLCTNLMRDWGFLKGPRGFLDMNAALSDQLALPPGGLDESEAKDDADSWKSSTQGAFQEKWDAVRRNIYGNMYTDCWLPCEERGSASFFPLPSEEVHRIKAGIQSPSLDQFANNQRDELTKFLKREATRKRLKEQAEKMAKATPKLGIDEVLMMQAELRDGFASPKFQKDLANLLHEHRAVPLKLALLRAELVFDVQKDILVKYGFKGDRQSVGLMLKSFEIGFNVQEFQETSDQCNYLLGLEHYVIYLDSPEERAETARQCEEWKEFFRNGGWEAWNRNNYED